MYGWFSVFSDYPAQGIKLPLIRNDCVREGESFRYALFDSGIDDVDLSICESVSEYCLVS